MGRFSLASPQGSLFRRCRGVFRVGGGSGLRARERLKTIGFLLEPHALLMPAEPFHEMFNPNTLFLSLDITKGVILG